MLFNIHVIAVYGDFISHAFCNHNIIQKMYQDFYNFKPITFKGLNVHEDDMHKCAVAVV